MLTCTSYFDSILVDNVIAVNESPPNSSKLSSILMFSTRSILLNIFINSLSNSFLGFIISFLSFLICGSGNDFLSIFPFGVYGICANFIIY